MVTASEHAIPIISSAESDNFLLRLCIACITLTLVPQLSSVRALQWSDTVRQSRTLSIQQTTFKHDDLSGYVTTVRSVIRCVTIVSTRPLTGCCCCCCWIMMAKTCNISIVNNQPHWLKKRSLCLESSIWLERNFSRVCNKTKYWQLMSIFNTNTLDSAIFSRLCLRSCSLIPISS